MFRVERAGDRGIWINKAYLLNSASSAVSLSEPLDATDMAYLVGSSAAMGEGAGSAGGS